MTRASLDKVSASGVSLVGPMLPGPLDKEMERWFALQRRAMLDPHTEEAFHRVVRLGARMVHAPICLLTLVEEDRPWFGASYGAGLEDTPGLIPFCAQALRQDEMLIVSDATCDARFSKDALVAGEPHVRAYAGVPLRGQDGAKLGTLGVLDRRARRWSARERELLQDLAELAVEELELRLVKRERSQMAAAMMTTTAAVVVTDPRQPDNPIVSCNPAFLKLSGYSMEEVIGRNCRFLQGPESDSATIESIRASLRSGHGAEAALLNYRKDGTPFWNEIRIAAIRGREDEILNFVGVQTDITARRRSEEAIRNSYEQLRAVEQQRDDLTHMIVHDLRGPLAFSIGLLDVLAEMAQGRLTPRAGEIMGAIRGAARTLDEMIMALLDVNRLEAGEMPVELESHDLRDLVQSTLAGPIIVEGARLKVELPDQPCLAACDATLVPRIITNLVGNALKFTPRTGHVVVRVEHLDARVQLSVRDTGQGIPGREQARVFDKFAQVGMRRVEYSSGLGLTFCKLAVEAQGGEIGVESEEGKGSRFWFSLPGEHSQPVLPRNQGCTGCIVSDS